MFLYHSKNNHYDLLVKEDSRKALINPSVSKKEKVEKLSEEWKTVKSRKQNSNKKVSDEEELLKEDESNEIRDSEDVNGLEEELVLIKNKNSGHRRTDPQASAESVDNNLIFKCHQCAKELESNGLLSAHMSTHEAQKFACRRCNLEFEKSLDLEMHKIERHEVCNQAEEWNCNDCFYQSITASDLMKHLKITGHQPSQNIQDKRRITENATLVV